MRAEVGEQRAGLPAVAGWTGWAIMVDAWVEM